MESKYFHTQKGNTMLIAMLIGICITGVSLGVAAMFIKKQAEEIPVLFTLIGIGTITLLLVCTYLFHSLTVEITNNELKFWFGPGLINKTIVLDEILSAKTIRTTIANGWGIHSHGNGCVYNVSGFDAVEVKLKNGKELCIGTDEPDTLTAAINSAIA